MEGYRGSRDDWYDQSQPELCLSWLIEILIQPRPATSHTNQAWHAHPTLRFASAKMFAVILMFIVEKYHLNSAVSSSHATGQPLLENLQTTKIFTQSLYRIFTNKNKTTTEKNLLYRKNRYSSKDFASDILFISYSLMAYKILGFKRSGN